MYQNSTTHAEHDIIIILVWKWMVIMIIMRLWFDSLTPNLIPIQSSTTASFF